MKIVRSWTATDELGNSDEYLQVFLIHDTIPPVIRIASDTLYMTSLDYATNGSGANIISITDNCGTVNGDIETTRVDEGGQLRYEFDIVMADDCGNSSIGHFMVFIVEKPPIVDVSFKNPNVVAYVDGGVKPYKYDWFYQGLGNTSWIGADSKTNMLNVEELGVINKVRVLVTDQRGRVSEDQIDLTTPRTIADRAKAIVGMYPNPATDYVDLRIDRDNVSRIEMYNVWGQRVKIFEFDKMDKMSRIQLDIRDLPQGTFSVRILSDQDVYTRQLIKVVSP